MQKFNSSTFDFNTPSVVPAVAEKIQGLMLLTAALPELEIARDIASAMLLVVTLLSKGNIVSYRKIIDGITIIKIDYKSLSINTWEQRRPY